MNTIPVNINDFVELLQKWIKETEEKNRTRITVPIGVLAATLQMAEFYQLENKLLFIDKKYVKNRKQQQTKTRY